jgi:hypothetical protein
VLVCLFCLPLANSAAAQEERPARVAPDSPRSPVRGIDGSRGDERRERPGEFQSIDGSGNNPGDPEMGAAHTPLRRAVATGYADGLSAMAGAGRPGPRTISNLVVDQPESRPNGLGASDFLWQWGQFLDHDIDLTDGTDPPEPANIPIPAGDAWFDPDGTGSAMLPFNRSLYDSDTGSDSPRQQVNEITAWIDASNVYGSDVERALALRTNDGTGRLRTSEGGLLPFNTEGLANAGGSGPTLFLAGDVRANEQVGLTALHTLFVREHNRLAEQIAAEQPRLSGEEIYQRARRTVIAEMQVITYREFLPALLGPDPLPPYRGYDPSVDASIANVFSTAAYRFGHSALSETLLRLDENGDEVAAGHLALRDAFFAPQRITDEGGIDPILRGLASQVCQSIDAYVIDDVRNFLFGPPGAGGFDLAALNIQRGRDHGLPSYNDVRAGLGLARAESFADVSSDPELQSRLAEAYGDVDAIDAWLGGLAEDPLPGAMVGELVATVVREQFRVLRDGDRFWYANTLDAQQRDQLERTRLADVIRRNTGIAGELPDDVFRVPLFPTPTLPSAPSRPPRR